MTYPELRTACLVNGKAADAVIPVVDSAVVRGDGCFEAIRSYQGVPFAVRPHLERLRRSAHLLDLEPPPLEEMEAWVRQTSEELGDGIVRVFLTRGSAVPGVELEGRCIVFGHSTGPLPETLTLASVVAPWHPAGRSWELGGAKTLSYAPNQAATRMARRRGGDDALLVSGEEILLESPTSSVAWVVDGVVETPSLDLGILDSITRRFVIELAVTLGIEVEQGRFSLARLGTADEVMLLSTVREIVPITRVDEWEYPAGEVTARLRSGFEEVVAGSS